jgi:hypothetical protein
MEIHVRRINRCLNTRLIQICQRTVQLEELTSKLYHYLPSPLQEHCHVGSFNRGCLVIVARDPVWASQLRYSLPELRDKLRIEAGVYQLSSIKVTIATTEATHSIKQPNAPSLSTKARDAITAGGDQCSYLPLKKALHHLATIESNEENDEA